MPPAGAEACARKARTGSIKIALAPPSALACMKFLRVMVSFIFISISRESFLQFGLQGLVLGHGPIGSFRETADRRPTPEWIYRTRALVPHGFLSTRTNMSELLLPWKRRHTLSTRTMAFRRISGTVTSAATRPFNVPRVNAWVAGMKTMPG